MVTDLRDYPWSSYASHGLGRMDPLVQMLPCADLLRAGAEARQTSWRSWAHTPLTERELTAARRSVVSGWPFGGAASVENMTASLGVRVATRRCGRPKKEATVEK
jgi:hypothetical protein